MSTNNTVRLTVSPEVARLVKEASLEEQLAVVRGETDLPLKDLLTVHLFLFQSGDSELKSAITTAMSALDGDALASLAAGDELHPKHLELIARVRLDDPRVIGALLKNPRVAPTTLKNVAAHCNGAIFALIAGHRRLLAAHPEIAEALTVNSRTEPEVKRKFGLLVEEPLAEAENAAEGDATGEAEVDPENLSKYQMSLELPVAEKIKMALTGDKEWRNIFIKDANKLVSSAVLKNPRITDGEVLAIAKNKSSSDELIRLIVMNNEWLKNYEIKRALVLHNRTPLPKALRFMTILTDKDLKSLAKSRDVSSVIVNNARRMLLAKEKKN
ncbi:MAG: hypothetical protein A2X84_06905 [Desulfuromonadaceae bacterium GWC2_58_13]|nr:MAG: hypothetical protein A2X84_06905 [Desulfuromonadaceae bacterium GWC2_58_13]